MLNMEDFNEFMEFKNVKNLYNKYSKSDFEDKAVGAAAAVLLGIVCFGAVIHFVSNRKKYIFEVDVEDGGTLEDMTVREIEFPKSCKLEAIIRDGVNIRFKGSTYLQAADKLVIKTSDSNLSKFGRYING